ncbi:hypothetical protein Trydic_g13579 [Trypoxylus dichotomus]
MDQVRSTNKRRTPVSADSGGKETTLNSIPVLSHSGPLNGNVSTWGVLLNVYSIKSLRLKGNTKNKLHISTLKKVKDKIF